MSALNISNLTTSMLFLTLFSLQLQLCTCLFTKVRLATILIAVQTSTARVNAAAGIMATLVMIAATRPALRASIAVEVAEVPTMATLAITAQQALIRLWLTIPEAPVRAAKLGNFLAEALLLAPYAHQEGSQIQARLNAMLALQGSMPQMELLAWIVTQAKSRPPQCPVPAIVAAEVRGQTSLLQRVGRVAINVLQENT